MRNLIFAVLAPSCVYPTPVAPDVSSDAAVVTNWVADAGPSYDGVLMSCARACANLSRLGCPEAEKPDGGDVCAVVCQRAEAKMSLKPACVAAAKTVVEVRACGTVRCAK